MIPEEFSIPEPELPVMEQKESIKLIKNSKGYNWEIKILSLDIDALEHLNNLMVIKFNAKAGDEKT